MRVLLGFFIFFGGVIASGLAGLLVWLGSTECPPNRLILSVILPEAITAEIFVQGRSIWKGSSNFTETINFPMRSDAGHFLVQKSDGTSQSIGSVSKADGRDHILLIQDDIVAYSSVKRGTIEWIRRNVACRN